jgi:hypothetical protein
VTNYAGNFWVFGYPGLPVPSRWAGSAKIPESMPDGTSKTILFTEKLGLCAYSPKNISSQDPVRTGGSFWAIPPLFPATAPGSTTKFNYAPVFGMNFNGDADVQDFQTQPRPGACDPFRASSFHHGGVNACMGDGSVRLVTTAVSHETWSAAITPAGDDLLGADWNN